jgi:hypothetical protein
MTRLNEVVAVERGLRPATETQVTKAYHDLQKPALFSGLSKHYESNASEGGDQLPDEGNLVQKKVEDVLAEIGKRLTRLFDVTLTRDRANQVAAADVFVDGTVLISNAPVTFLMFLEKQLTDLHTELQTAPTLNPGEDWQPDDVSGLYKTSEKVTHRTKKVTKPLVLYPATDKHPAQAQPIVEDVIEGYWHAVLYSGATTATRKTELLDRVTTLREAVKTARERANMIEVNESNIGSAVFGYLLAR